MTFARIAIAIVIAFVATHVVLFWHYGRDHLLDRSTEYAINTLERGQQAAVALSADPDLLPLLSSPSFQLRLVSEPGRERSNWHYTTVVRERVFNHFSQSAPTDSAMLDPATVLDYAERRGQPTMLAWLPITIASEPTPQASPLRWLEVTASPPRTRQSDRIRSAFGTTTLLLAVLLTLLWATRRFTRHLPRFADAAEALARGERIPLPESGPRDVRRLAQTFNNLSAQIQQTASDRSQMLGALGHDLRSAVTRLVLRTEGIHDEAQRRAAQRDLAELQALMEQSVRFARDEHATEAYDQIDLVSLLQTAVDDATETGADVRFDGPPKLDATVQPVGLRRAIDNLISNAVRYGDQARVALSANDVVTISVSDNGPGIREAERSRVTQAFYRLEPSRNRESGGAGLGLAIVAGVMRRHGGELSFSHPASGFTATLTFPRQPPQPA